MLQTLLIVTGDLEENCYLLWKHSPSDSSPKPQASSLNAIVFDPGDEAPRIDSELKARHLCSAAFILTHCHGDHIAALSPMKAIYPGAPLYVPEAEKEWLKRPTLNLSYFYGISVTGPEPDHLVKDGQVINVADITLRAIHVPGHSPGGTAYFVEQNGAPPHLFCGDILFAGGIGRTDLPGGDGENVLIMGIQNKLFTLPDNTIVHPGHGPETTIGYEKENNPFCGM